MDLSLKRSSHRVEWESLNFNYCCWHCGKNCSNPLVRKSFNSHAELVTAIQLMTLSFFLSSGITICQHVSPLRRLNGGTFNLCRNPSKRNGHFLIPPPQKPSSVLFLRKQCVSEFLKWHKLTRVVNLMVILVIVQCLRFATAYQVNCLKSFYPTLPLVCPQLVQLFIAQFLLR